MSAWIKNLSNGSLIENPDLNGEAAYMSCCNLNEVEIDGNVNIDESDKTIQNKEDQK